MPTLEEIQVWIAERSKKDAELYERYGRPLEAEHVGKFVAISDDGEIILGTDYLAVSDEAVERFGAGDFALRKIGADAEFHMRSPRFMDRMPAKSKHRAWIDYRDQQDERLYEQYGRPLEAEHTGEFVAIRDDGEIFLGTDLLNVTMEAVERFGPGTYALRRIGHEADLHMRTATA